MPKITPPERIEVQIEGFPEDGGAVRLDALYNFLAEVKRTLAAIERDVTDNERAVLAYKIVILTYSSPIRCVLESVQPKLARRNLGNIVARRFDQDIREIESGILPTKTKNRKSRTIEPSTLEQFERLAVQRKQAGKISVGLENNPLPITTDFDEKLKRLLGNIYKSRGTFRGRLEAINIHTTPCILQIYPVAGPNRIRCTYPKGRFPRIGDHLEHTVDVSGIVKYRGDEPHPYEIEIETITPLRPKDDRSIANSLVGCMPDLTDGKDIPSYLREIRHE